MNTGNARFFLAAGVAVVALGAIATGGKAASAPFMVTSSSFADGGMLSKKNAADDPMRMCGGENVSPALAWSNAPAKSATAQAVPERARQNRLAGTAAAALSAGDAASGRVFRHTDRDASVRAGHEVCAAS